MASHRGSLCLNFMAKFSDILKEIKRPSKSVLDSVVKSMQLYLGSLDKTRIKDQEKLRRKVDSNIERICKITNMDFSDAWDQIEMEAKKRGKIIPVPGKDI